MFISGVIGPIEISLILGVFLLLFFLPIIAIIDIVRSRFTGNNNIVFILIVVFMPILGSLIYFMIGPSKKIRN